MSFVLVTPEALSAAAADTARIGSAINAATTAAAAQTTSVVAAAGDEVSAAVATLFGTYGQTYQALAAQASTLHQQFENALTAAGSSYAGAEAANAAPLQQTQAAFSTVERDVLSAVNAPSLALTGRPLIGNGADGGPGQAGGAGGWLYGNGGNGGNGVNGGSGGKGGSAGQVGGTPGQNGSP